MQAKKFRIPLYDPELFMNAPLGQRQPVAHGYGLIHLGEQIHQHHAPASVSYTHLLLSPNPGQPAPSLSQALNATFGSMDGFKTAMKTAAMAQFGSGYAWLVLDQDKLCLLYTSNLKLAAAPIHRVLIRPGETFSFWMLVRGADRKQRYLDGLNLENGRIVGSYGGGLCQLSNLLFWLFRCV